MDIHGSTAHTSMLGKRVLLSSAATALRVGTANLPERKWLIVQNASAVPIYVGAETAQGTAFTAAKLAKEGLKIGKGDIVWFPVSDKITVYARIHTDGTSSSGFARVAELA